MDTCKNNPVQFSGIAVSKLNKKNCLKVLANFVLIFVVFLCGSFQPPKTKLSGVTKVVIDAGHGGHDSGCLGRNSKEKDIALSISLKLGKYIEEHYSNVEVIYTRKTDKFLELHERAEIANNARADLFICIHCNSACMFDKKKKKEVCNRQIEGVESWVMGLNKTDANLEVAKRENEVILLEKDYTSQYDGFDPNSPEANIIFSLYQNTFLEQSLRMASLVQQEVKGKGRGGRGVKQAGFLVLFKTYMPSILIETGFLSNEKEEKYLMSVKGQDEIASAIFRAFQQYKGSHENVKEQESPKGKSEVQKEEVKTEKPEVKSEDKKPEKPEVKEKAVDANKVKTVEKETDKPVASIKPVVQNGGEEKKNGTDSLKNKPVTEPSIISNADDVLQWGVQFYTAAKAVPDNHKIYKNFDDVREDYEKGIYKYSTGIFATRQDAVKLQSKIRSMGYNDAFVVAFFNGKKISIKEAMDMESKKTN